MRWVVCWLQVDYEGTSNLVAAAKREGVRKFVLVGPRQGGRFAAACFAAST